MQYMFTFCVPSLYGCMCIAKGSFILLSMLLVAGMVVIVDVKTDGSGQCALNWSGRAGRG